MKIRNVILFYVVLFSAGVQAADARPGVSESEQQIAEVAVNGTKDPGLKPYRIMSGGLDAFDEYRSHAPEAVLRFRLSKHGERNWYAENWDGVRLRMAGNDSAIPVPIAVDGTFILPRSQQAYDDDADLILNQKKSLIRFSADVRTPGVPENARRLGDNRLECQVMMGIGKKELGFARRAVFNTIFLGGHWCSSKRATYGFPLPGGSIKTTLNVGGTRTIGLVWIHYFRSGSRCFDTG
jgi:hypothetical protein